MTYIKRDLVEDVYQAHGGMSRDEAAGYVDQLIQILMEGLQRDGKVTIKHFGSFRLKQTRSRRVKLPSGAWTRSRSGWRVQFLPAISLKAALNREAL